jgi:DNA-directed RNA polymerase specialized sigma24 family protein
MSNEDSVSRWLKALRTGSDAEIQLLWEHYVRCLVELAGTRLRQVNRDQTEEEKAALDVFQSFSMRVDRNQFPPIDDGKDLWRLLSTITARKVIRELEHGSCERPRGGRALNETAMQPNGQTENSTARFIRGEPTLESADEFTKDVEQLLRDLGHETLKTIALRTLKGDSSSAIARELGMSTRTIQGKLEVICEIWGSTSE